MYKGNYNIITKHVPFKFSNFRQAVVREALFQLRKSKLNGEKSYSHSDKNLYARTISESSELY